MKITRSDLEAFLERFLSKHPRLFRLIMRSALYSNPLIVERMVIGKWLEQVFGPVEAKRWIEHLEKEKRRIYGRRKL